MFSLENNHQSAHLTAIIFFFLFLKGPAQDEVIAKLRYAFLGIVREYKVYTEEERKKVSFVVG